MEVPRPGVESKLQPEPHQIQAESVTYTIAHGNARSLTHWARPGIEPAFSGILVGFGIHCATTGTPRTIIHLLGLFWGKEHIECIQVFVGYTCWEPFLLDCEQSPILCGVFGSDFSSLCSVDLVLIWHRRAMYDMLYFSYVQYVTLIRWWDFVLFLFFGHACGMWKFLGQV